ncbi:MAG: hypothetical protein QOD74_2745, partial [Variibacter sp.]|nr:hypothetical protein [Variibacter sp.]
MPSSALTYRPDVDFLRAVAVISVIGFHWQLGLPGGYVGVDIFFVISGYLITSLIAAEIGAGTFSFVQFYARRIRRILPALYAMLAILLIVSWFVLLPSDYINLFQETLATTGFVSNILFWLQAGYFERTANDRPLLHTWSLSVEEQFYIVFPLLLWFLLRKGPASSNRARNVLLAVTAASFALGLYQVMFHPTAAFFLAPGRIWELLLGALLALKAVPAPRSRGARYAALGVGSALIVIAVIIYRDGTPFPGINALLPCLGAALIIWAGETGNEAAPDHLLLRSGAAIGRVSYSLYLWHWPAFVYAKVWFGEIGALTPIHKAIALALVVAFSVASYFWIELPIRRRQWLASRRALFAATGAATILLMAPTALGLVAKGFPERLAAEALRIASYADYDHRSVYRSGTCFLSAEQRADAYDVTHCWPEKGNGKEKMVLLWGDSHAAHYVPGLEALFKGSSFRLAQATASACPPIFGVTIGGRPHCGEFNDLVRELIRARKPDLVL